MVSRVQLAMTCSLRRNHMELNNLAARRGSPLDGEIGLSNDGEGCMWLAMKTNISVISLHSRVQSRVKSPRDQP